MGDMMSLRRRMITASNKEGEDLIVSSTPIQFEIIQNYYVDAKGTSSTPGGLVPYTGWSATDYIPVGNGILICSTAQLAFEYSAAYDSNKTFKYKLLPSAGYKGRCAHFFIFPIDGVAYVRLSDTSSNVSKLRIYQVLEGIIKYQ